MNVPAWKWKNNVHKAAARARHPWPFYKKAGGINAVVIHADGSRDDLGRVSATYIRRGGWKVGTK